jgi:hypothetical protein
VLVEKQDLSFGRRPHFLVQVRPECLIPRFTFLNFYVFYLFLRYLLQLQIKQTSFDLFIFHHNK